jgi:hypothetical protein
MHGNYVKDRRLGMPTDSLIFLGLGPIIANTNVAVYSTADMKVLKCQTSTTHLL